jgi:hypothetical protein
LPSLFWDKCIDGYLFDAEIGSIQDVIVVVVIVIVIIIIHSLYTLQCKAP